MRLISAGPMIRLLDPHDAVGFGPHPEAVDRGLGVGQGQVALLRKQQVVVQVVGELLVEGQALGVEGNGFRGPVVGPEDGGVAPAVSRSQVALLQDGDVGDPEAGQIVGGGQSVDAGADHHHVVAVAERMLPPHGIEAEQA